MVVEVSALLHYEATAWLRFWRRVHDFSGVRLAAAGCSTAADPARVLLQALWHLTPIVVAAWRPPMAGRLLARAASAWPWKLPAARLYLAWRRVTSRKAPIAVISRLPWFRRLWSLRLGSVHPLAMLIAAAAAFASAAGGRHGEVGTDAQQPPTHPPEDREEAMPVSLLLFFGAALAAGAVLWTGLVAPAGDDHDAKSRPSRAAGTSTDVDPTTLPASSPPLRRHRAWSSPGRLDATAETSPAQTAPLVFAGDVPARTARRGDLEAIEAENAALREHISVMQGSLDHAALGLLRRGIDDLVAQREEVGGQLARLLHGAPAAAGRPAGGPSSPRSAASPLESGAATRIQAQQRGATARRAAAAAELEAGVVAIELQIEFLRGQARARPARVSESLAARPQLAAHTKSCPPHLLASRCHTGEGDLGARLGAPRRNGPRRHRRHSGCHPLSRRLRARALRALRVRRFAGFRRRHPYAGAEGRELEGQAVRAEMLRRRQLPVEGAVTHPLWHSAVRTGSPYIGQRRQCGRASGYSDCLGKCLLLSYARVYAPCL